MTQNAEPVPPEGLFAGKYRLVRMIGKGAMGEVWLAEEEGPRNFRRRVAVKKLISTSEIGELATSSFVAEAQVIAKLDHHNIEAVERSRQRMPGKLTRRLRCSGRRS